jgi:luciferase family oxidoreductase group 1
VFSAELAAARGLPFAFASHFAPDLLMPALQIYRSQFRPSESLDRPYAMAGVGVFAADTDAEARRLFTSLQQQFLNLRRGRPGPVPPPVDSMDGLWTPMEQAMLEHTFSCAIVGDPDIVRRGLDAFADRTGVDEIIVTAQIYDHAARLRSFEIVAQVATR